MNNTYHRVKLFINHLLSFDSYYFVSNFDKKRMLRHYFSLFNFPKTRKRFEFFLKDEKYPYSNRGSSFTLFYLDNYHNASMLNLNNEMYKSTITKEELTTYSDINFTNLQCDHIPPPYQVYNIGVNSVYPYGDYSEIINNNLTEESIGEINKLISYIENEIAEYPYTTSDRVNSISNVTLDLNLIDILDNIYKQYINITDDKALKNKEELISHLLLNTNNKNKPRIILKISYNRLRHCVRCFNSNLLSCSKCKDGDNSNLSNNKNCNCSNGIKEMFLNFKEDDACKICYNKGSLTYNETIKIGLDENFLTLLSNLIQKRTSKEDNKSNKLTINLMGSFNSHTNQYGDLVLKINY